MKNTISIVGKDRCSTTSAIFYYHLISKVAKDCHCDDHRMGKTFFAVALLRTEMQSPSGPACQI